MKLVTVAYIEQLESYFKKLGISTKVLDPFKSLSSSIASKKTFRKISHPIQVHKASPFRKESDKTDRTYLHYAVTKLPHSVDQCYLSDLIEAYDVKEEISMKTKGSYLV
jgi:hypothetical protein